MLVGYQCECFQSGLRQPLAGGLFEMNGYTVVVGSLCKKLPSTGNFYQFKGIPIVAKLILRPGNCLPDYVFSDNRLQALLKNCFEIGYRFTERSRDL